jgi:hypothetical protein
VKRLETDNEGLCGMGGLFAPLLNYKSSEYQYHKKHPEKILGFPSVDGKNIIPLIPSCNSIPEWNPFDLEGYPDGFRIDEIP